VDPSLRRLYNAAYSESLYAAVKREMSLRLATPTIEFRLAETPVFFSPELSARCERTAAEILALMADPVVVARCAERIPPAFRLPTTDALPQMVAVDLALTRDAAGEIVPRLIECQGFPSLYAMTVIQGDIWAEALRTIPELRRAWSCYWGGLDRPSYLDLLRRTVVGDCDPEEVVLVDIDPATQKTRPDFVATERLLGVRSVCVTDLVQEGRRLYAPRGDGADPSGGRRTPVRRIYNRIVFDELIATGVTPPFDYRESLDVTWVPNPNWYWIWSKATIPLLDHPAVPRAHFLSELGAWPDDLSRFVLKPLYSFAGRGVVIDVDRAVLDAIPEAARPDWLLMEKVEYAPALLTPDGQGVKVELRVLFLRPDGARDLTPATNLCRLSRAKMHGVDYNKDFDWVGSSVAMWAI